MKKQILATLKNEKMKKLIFKTLLFIVLANTGVNAQVGIGVSTENINPSAQLEVLSTNKGFLPPRMTTAQRDLINSPATGLVIFNTTTNSLEYKSSTGWVSLTTITSTPTTTAVFSPTIVIGAQQWMEKNLNTSFYRNGDTIPYVTDETQWANLTSGAWCYYNNDPANGEIYGKLYNWYAVNDSRGLAPTGWHVATATELTTLTTTLGGASVAGGKMKSAGTTWRTPNTGANNSSGFTGLPGGVRDLIGSFSQIGTHGYFWSSTEFNTTSAKYLGLMYFNNSVLSLSYPKSFGFSVRCIKD